MACFGFFTAARSNILFRAKGERMNFLYIFKAMPLPLMAILLPLCGVLFMSITIFYSRFGERRGVRVSVPKIYYKLPFLVVIIAELVFSYRIWAGVEFSPSPFYILSPEGWRAAVSADDLKNIQALLNVDAFGAVSALMMSFVAFIAGLRAFSDKRNLITPQKAAFFLLTCCGIHGMFFSSGLALLFIFMMLVQAGVTGLYSGYAFNRRHGLRHTFYYISRVLLLVMFLAGAVMLRIEYGTDNLTTLAALIKDTVATRLSFVLISVPLLYIFFKPSPYLPDASKICFFGIRTQASLFVAFRVIFTLYGPLDSLGKVPALLLMLGFASIGAAVFLLSGERSPLNFMDSMIMYIKGMVIATTGIALSGTFGAERAALYGVSALESMVGLWLLFLPVSAGLAVSTVYLNQEYDGCAFWQEGYISSRAPLSFLTLFIVLISLAGLPPFIGFSSKQLLFRSANFLSPIVVVVLFLFTVIMLMMGLRFLLFLALNRSSQKNEFHFAGETTIAFPLILLLISFAAASAAPGYVFERMVSPSVGALINKPFFASQTAAGAGAVSVTRIATGFFTWDVYKWLLVFLIVAAVGAVLTLFCRYRFGQTQTKTKRKDVFAALKNAGNDSNESIPHNERALPSAFSLERFAIVFAERYLRPWRDIPAGGLCGIAALFLLFAAAIF